MFDLGIKPIPEAKGGIHTEGTVTNRCKIGSGLLKEVFVRGAKAAGWLIVNKKLPDVKRGWAVDGLVDNEEHLELDASRDGQPVEAHQEWCYVLSGLGSSNDASSTVLDSL